MPSNDDHGQAQAQAPAPAPAPGRPKRTSLEARESCTASHVSQSPSAEGRSPPHRTTTHYRAQRPVVRLGRMGSRNRSYGKNLNALTKLTRAPRQEADASEVKTHWRSQSGGSTPGTSPKTERAGIRRNASAVVLSRNTSSVSLRKNLSSGQLRKNLSSGKLQKNLSSGQLRKNLSSGQLQKNLSSGQLRKNLSSGQLARACNTKNAARKGHQASRKSPSHQPKATVAPDVPHPTVRFAVGNDDDESDQEIEEVEGVDDGWTEVEDSGSQSPNTTRSNTRQNSVILGSSQVALAHDVNKEPQPPESGRTPGPETQPSRSTPQEAGTSPLTHRPHAKTRTPSDDQPPTSGTFSRPQQSTRVPSDADVITSRLLQRHRQHHASPQVSNISASVHGRSNIRNGVSDMNQPTTSHTPGTSKPSTLKSSISGKDLVSRFINKGGESAEGTPADSKYLLHRSANNDLTTSRANDHLRAAEDEAAKHKDGEDGIKGVGKELDGSRRNKSTPNMTIVAAAAAASSSTATLPADRPSTPSSLFDRSGSGSRRSGSSTPGQGPGQSSAGGLSLNRAEQKLLLQRDASVLETNIDLNVPGVLPMSRSGKVPSFRIGGGVDGKKRRYLDPRMRRCTEEVEREYAVIRRFRNPVADAIVRARMFNGWGSGGTEKGVAVGNVRANATRGGAGGGEGMNEGGSGGSGRPRGGVGGGTGVRAEGGRGQYGLSQSLKEGREGDKGKRRVSFEVRDRRRSRDDADMDVEDGDGGERVGGSEVEDICRRIWEGFGRDGWVEAAAGAAD